MDTSPTTTTTTTNTTATTKNINTSPPFLLLEKRCRLHAELRAPCLTPPHGITGQFNTEEGRRRACVGDGDKILLAAPVAGADAGAGPGAAVGYGSAFELVYRVRVPAAARAAASSAPRAGRTGGLVVPPPPASSARANPAAATATTAAAAATGARSTFNAAVPDVLDDLLRRS